MKRLISIHTILAALILLALPGTVLGWAPPGYSAPGYASPALPPGMYVRRHLDASNYYISVLLEGIEPEDIAVSVEQGRWLVLQGSIARHDEEEAQSEDGARYSRSYRFSNSRLTRRVHLPRDADHAALQRVDLENKLEITIPRRR